ncbi:MAG: UDP-2,3-diacylglucosamine diphosphatase [Betaproteobacteria bacterium]|nr:UDP-2,3-diacylglucosamine diphosphatase [Betaproteobacteria bacterium]MBI3935723.1 UDP-2,3-diacylglucosamine diphosphatase [Betaproteobacteria bacterium]
MSLNPESRIPNPVSHTLFISDLHLSPARQRINAVFFDFLARTAPQAEALYILGDLFEYWAGDDDTGPELNRNVPAALKQLAAAGVRVYLMHGNRDFLIGERFLAACGAALIGDPLLMDFYGRPTLLMHGDTLCTDDVDYQRFRAQVRAAGWQCEFLAQPLARRRQTIEALRTESERHKRDKPAAVMDVNAVAVGQVLRQHGYPRLIHGHTHRPARHEHLVDNHACERWVLPDWYERGGYLRCDATGCTAVSL